MLVLPMQRFFERSVGGMSDRSLKAALLGMTAWMLILLKKSTSVRSWTQSIVKFLVYVATVIGIVICSALIFIKYKISKPTKAISQTKRKS